MLLSRLRPCHRPHSACIWKTSKPQAEGRTMKQWKCSRTVCGTQTGNLWTFISMSDNVCSYHSFCEQIYLLTKTVVKFNCKQSWMSDEDQRACSYRRTSTRLLKKIPQWSICPGPETSTRLHSYDEVLAH